MSVDTLLTAAIAASIPSASLPGIVGSAGFSTPVITATRPSEFGGHLYVAASDRLADAAPPPVVR